MEIGSRMARNAREAWRPIRWLLRHRSEFTAVAALALMLAPLLL